MHSESNLEYKLFSLALIIYKWTISFYLFLNFPACSNFYLKQSQLTLAAFPDRYRVFANNAEFRGWRYPDKSCVTTLFFLLFVHTPPEALFWGLAPTQGREGSQKPEYLHISSSSILLLYADLK